jgi:superfamily II DNA or RNA helicase
MKNREIIQEEALKAIEGKRKAGLGISMGVGKTLIGLKYLEKLHPTCMFKRYLIVGPKLAIWDSWKSECVKHKMTHLLPHLEFSTYLSLNKVDGTMYDVVILDECHSLKYSHDHWLATFPGRILGLTGTPPRYKTSEKGRLVDVYCPIQYTYIMDSAVDDEILNDYKIVVHVLPLSSERNMPVKKRDGSYFMNSERKAYEYWSDQLRKIMSPKELQIKRIMRMKALMGFPTKEKYAKQLLDMIHDKCIVFCNTTEQADWICEHSYHSKNPDSADNLKNFKSGKITELSCVQQLNEGVNIPDLKAGIILHSYSNERQSSQRIGRLLRLNPKDKSTIHILAYKDTVDMDWVAEALKDIDSDKIVYTDSVFGA